LVKNSTFKFAKNPEKVGKLTKSGHKLSTKIKEKVIRN